VKNNYTWQVYFRVPIDEEWPADFAAEMKLLNEIKPGTHAAGSADDDPEKIYHTAVYSETEDIEEYLQTMLISFDLDSTWSIEWLQSAWDILDHIENEGTDEEYITKVPDCRVYADMAILSRFFRGAVDEVDDDGNPVSYFPAPVDNCSVFAGHTKPYDQP